MTTDADAAVTAFIAEHPAYSVDEEQPAYRGGTNHVTFGCLRESPVVFKRFVTPDRWANELACLAHFAPTGLVPEILDTVPQQLIVMSRLAGSGVHAADPTQIPAVSEAIGRSLARLVEWPLPRGVARYCPARDFRAILWGKTPLESLDLYLVRCRAIAKVVPACRDPLFQASLAGLESQAAVIAQQQPALFHEDVFNLMVDGGRLVGFYDLEMCRLGTEPMQLGVAMSLCLDGPLSWPHLLAGFQAQTGRTLGERDLAAVLAMYDFYHWIRICRWGMWDGNPSAEPHLAAAVKYAEGCRPKMQAARILISGLSFA